MSENKFEDIYDVVKLIPSGRVSTYGFIAEYLGSKGGARLVGWAMNACHGRADVPAHRVVNALGMLTGKNFFATPSMMQELLEAEGVEIKNDKVQDFQHVVWRPVEELL